MCKWFFYYNKYLIIFFFLFFIVEANADAKLGGEELRDPTMPFANINKSGLQKNIFTSMKIKRNYALQSIFISIDSKVVIIDNKEYREGQRIDNYKISKINDGNVIISTENKSKVLYLYSAGNIGINEK